jgi:C1A family cysteine protease
VKCKKNYKNFADEVKSKLKFLEKRKFIKNHNKKFDDDFVDYSLAINCFTDKYPDEIENFTTGHIVPEEEFNDFVVAGRTVANIYANDSDYPPGPSTIDYRTLGHVTPVKDQGFLCNSCWAFSSLACLECHLSM